VTDDSRLPLVLVEFVFEVVTDPLVGVLEIPEVVCAGELLPPPDVPSVGIDCPIC
jgi:hypothetical protein